MLLYCKLKMVLLNLQLPKSKIFPGKRGERKKVEKGEETHTNQCPAQKNSSKKFSLLFSINTYIYKEFNYYSD